MFWERRIGLAILMYTISLVLAGDSDFIWDSNGYVIYCPCMGRFGNQADHFLGALGFTKKLNRTLVLPPWRTYKNVPFNEWFQVDPIQEYHRAILAEDFMAKLAPTYWPPERRSGWCYILPNNKDAKCAMKEGNPFGPFWDGLGVDFVDYVTYTTGYQEIDKWKKKYPSSKYPVMAFKGAPAAFPVQEEFVELHRYLQWSDKIEEEVLAYINKSFPGEKFVGIHLRNGIDWENACKHADGQARYMSSPQCLGYGGNKKVTSKLCFPPKEEVLRLVKNAIISTKAKVLFVATDKDPMIKELENHLTPQKVRVFHLDPWLPQIDLAILGRSDHFIGNCVSSFTAFVARERKVKQKPTSYWGFS